MRRIRPSLVAAAGVALAIAWSWLAPTVTRAPSHSVTTPTPAKKHPSGRRPPTYAAARATARRSDKVGMPTGEPQTRELPTNLTNLHEW